MGVESDQPTIERAPDVWTIRFRPTELMVFAQPEATDALFEMLAEIRSHQVSVFRADYARGCLTPAVVDQFWEEVRSAPIVVGGRREAPVPLLVRNATNALPRLLKQLKGMPTLTMASFQGEIDFDLFGVLLAAHYRVCTEDTVFVNRVLDRDAAPGSAMYWMLTRYLGLATTNHLLLNGVSLTAQEALELRLVNRVVPREDLEAEAEAIAQQFAAKPTRAVSSLAVASSHLDADLASYLERVGSGFAL
jgi:hypothetical protein